MGRDDTGNRILRAALAEFARHGYSGASTNAIAVAAGVAKGSVFSHFRSKAKLYAAVFHAELDRMLDELDRFDAGPKAPVFERIVDVLSWKARYAANHPEATRVLLDAFADPPPEAAEAIASRLLDLGKTSVRRFFGDLDWNRFLPELTREDIYRTLETAAAGLQAAYVRPGMDLHTMESIRDQSVAFMKTVVRGMEKHDGQDGV